MEFNFCCVFFNPLLNSKIFSYLDNRNLSTCRLICFKLAEAGETIVSKRNRHFTLESSINANRKIVRAANFEKLEWMEDCLKKPEKLWLFEKVELPIKEALQCKEVRNFIQKHGNQIKFLRLTKPNSIREQLLGIAEECISPFHLLHLILTKWCPNLTSIFVLEKHTDNWADPEIHFPAWEQLGVTLFEKPVKLESLTLKLIHGLDIPSSYFKQIVQNCPNLKIMRALIKNYKFRENLLDAGFLPDDGLEFLESLEITKVKRVTTFLESITQQKFPRLKTLSIEFKLPRELNKINNCRLANTNISRVDIKTNLREFPFEVLLQMFQNAEILTFTTLFKMDLRGELGANFCKISGSNYTKIKKIQLFAKLGQNINQVVVCFAQLCPNLEHFKLGEISSELDFSLKVAVGEIIKNMSKLKHFDLAVTNFDCVKKEIKELELAGRGKKGGKISYCVGNKEGIRNFCLGPKF